MLAEEEVSSFPAHHGGVEQRQQRNNLAWAAGYKIVAIPLASESLPFGPIMLSPAVGAILMSLSTIVVALNAQLLRRVDLQPTHV